MLVATQIKLLETDIKWVRCVHLCSMQHVTRRVTSCYTNVTVMQHLTRRVTSCYINVTSYAACGKARHINVTSHCAVCNDMVCQLDTSHQQPMSRVLNVTNQCPVEKFKAPAVASKPASADT